MPARRTHRFTHHLAAGVLTLTASGCNTDADVTTIAVGRAGVLTPPDRDRNCDDERQGRPEWCDGAQRPESVHMECEAPRPSHLSPPSGLRTELSRRRQVQWNALLEEKGQRTVEPGPPDPELVNWSAHDIVEQLRSDQVLPEEELVQACQAPDAIRQAIGGIAMLLDVGGMEMPAAGAKTVVLAAESVNSGGKEVCVTETAGDEVKLSMARGTLFFIDRHHLVGAAHTLPAELCKPLKHDEPQRRLETYVIAYGLTNTAITSNLTVEIPVNQFIDGSTVTVVECPLPSQKDAEGDWMLLRTDECICGADPLRVRWDKPIAAGEEIHVLGHAASLTLKYSKPPGKVSHSDLSVPRFFMDLVTDNGSSGAPIFDTAGNVIGIHNDRWTRCEQSCKIKSDRVSQEQCCARPKCNGNTCEDDGVATHIQRVKTAWQNSRATINDWEKCEPK